MYTYVKLLEGVKKELVYKVPAHYVHHIKIGSLVTVPLQKHIVSAIVQRLVEFPPTGITYTIKDLHAVNHNHFDPLYYPFLQKLSTYYFQEPEFFVKRIRQFLQQPEQKIIKNSYLPTNTHQNTHITLTQEQKNICNFIIQALHKAQYTPILLHGVTGSGKTEIYKEAISEAVSRGTTVLFLVPEVTLAVQFTTLLRKQLPSTFSILSFHSATAQAEKRYLWQALSKNQPVVIVGVHLPIMLPISNLGLIIIDEEHDTGYQEKKYPRVNTKEAALLRAQTYKIPIILGSATPSIATLYTATKNKWAFFELKKRFAGSFPSLTFVQLVKDTKRKYFWISSLLYHAIAATLAKKEQVIIFINRRGYSFFVQCSDCSFVFSCRHCSVSLTFHNSNKLICHYCNFSQNVPVQCPTCTAPHTRFLKKGIGTQQIVSILEKLFSHARIGRADLDTTINKKQWQKTITDFSQGNLDILVGTQTITKGYHFPNVTLVGIIWADVNLHMPFYNAAETTVQQLIQVAGRAGRQTETSTVIVQTLVDHPIFKFLHEQEYHRYYQYEIEQRAELHYPPCGRLCQIELKHTEETIVDQEAEALTEQLITGAEKLLPDQITILGPTPPVISRIKNIHARVIHIKSSTIRAVYTLYKSVNITHYKSTIYITPNPLN